MAQIMMEDLMKRMEKDLDHAKRRMEVKTIMRRPNLAGKSEDLMFPVLLGSKRLRGLYHQNGSRMRDATFITRFKDGMWGQVTVDKDHTIVDKFTVTIHHKSKKYRSKWTYSSDLRPYSSNDQEEKVEKLRRFQNVLAATFSTYLGYVSSLRRIMIPVDTAAAMSLLKS